MPISSSDRMQAEAIIGTVQREFVPVPGVARARRQALIPMYILSALLLLGATVITLSPPPEDQRRQPAIPFLLAGLGMLPAAGFYIVLRRYRILANRLLLGERGIAEITSDGMTILRNSELGTEWVVHVVDARNDGHPYPVFLALQHPKSKRILYISDFYTGAEELATIVRELLASNTSERNEAPVRRSSSTNIAE